jgi:hypothetical protein
MEGHSDCAARKYASWGITETVLVDAVAELDWETQERRLLSVALGTFVGLIYMLIGRLLMESVLTFAPCIQVGALSRNASRRCWSPSFCTQSAMGRGEEFVIAAQEERGWSCCDCCVVDLLFLQ